MRILIIEDNKELASIVQKALKEFGHILDVSYTGVDGEQKAFVTNYDCILLDLNLPDKDGLAILEFLRASNIMTPVIIITARIEVEQRTKGLDLGADDYLIKPFQISELRARIQAVVRRYYGRSNPLIKIGDIVINPSTRKIEIDNQEVVLSVKEYDIFEYIAQRHPAIVSAEEIVEHIYDEDFDPFSSALRVHLTRLRKKINTVYGKDILVTVRGKGYYLCVD